MLKILFLAGALTMTASVSMAIPTDPNCIKVLEILDRIGNKYKKLNDPEIDKFIAEARQDSENDHAGSCFNDVGGVASIEKELKTQKTPDRIR
jgi:hypothetical protein